MTFEKVAVVKTLKLVGKFNESFFVNNGDHILGTNKSDLFQRYNGRVRIKGDLQVKSLKVSPAARLVVSGNDINPDISKTYWTKSTDQVIYFQKLRPSIITSIANRHLTHRQLSFIIRLKGMWVL